MYILQTQIRSAKSSCEFVRFSKLSESLPNAFPNQVHRMLQLRSFKCLFFRHVRTQKNIRISKYGFLIGGHSNLDQYLPSS